MNEIDFHQQNINLNRMDLVEYKSLINKINAFTTTHDFDAKSNLLNFIYLKREFFNSLHNGLNIDQFFLILKECAFSTHSNDVLYLTTYKFLFYLAQNCTWCDEYFIKNNFHITGKELLLSNKFSMQFYLAAFLIQIMKKNEDSFHSIFDASVAHYFVTIIREKSLQDKIWALHSLQAIVSLKFFHDDESLDMILTLLEEIFSVESDLHLIDLSFSILSNVFICPCDDELKSRAANSLFLDVGVEVFDPGNESLCISILNFFINLLYYDNNSPTNYILNHSIIEAITSHHEIFLSSSKIMEKAAKFITNALSNEIFSKQVFDALSKTSFFPTSFINNVNQYQNSSQISIAIFSCKLILRFSVDFYSLFINPDVINFLLDEFMVDDDDLLANIICSFIKFIENAKIDIARFSEELDSLLDPTLVDRLEEIIQNIHDKEAPLSKAASLLETCLFSLKDELEAAEQ